MGSEMCIRDRSSTGERFVLPEPLETWPGSIYSALIAIHWEIVIEAIRDNGTKMKWIKPILIEDRKGLDPIYKLPVRSGRIESADQLG